MSIGVILNQEISTSMLPQIVVTPIVPFSSVTASNGLTTYDGTYNGTTWVIEVDDFGEYNVTGVKADGSGTSEDTVNVTVNQVYEIEMGSPTILPVLNDNSWETISYASTHNLGQSYWSVGDSKQITLSGTVGTVNFNNYTTWVYIIGFNHNEALEGQGITFGTFKTASSSGTDVALVDSYYGQTSTSGALWFNMNHSANTNAGGWKACDMRYNILGSTDADGQNASTNTATSPVGNTLIAALTNDLRSVMKPMAIYTDNVGGGSGSISSNVTMSIDYLPLLAEFEVFGSRNDANSYEQNYQKQYQYYINGNSKIKYQYNIIASSINWWERSVAYSVNTGFCFITTSGTENTSYAYTSRSISPIFRV